jgi:hypothetical protein
VPILDIDSTAAFGHLDGRHHSRWSDIFAVENTESIGSDFFRPRLRGTFRLNENSAGYVLGSCFAQQVQFALGKRQIPLRSSILDSPHEIWFLQDGKDYWPLHFFHRFNPRSMLQEFENILSESQSVANGELIFERPDGQFADYHYSPRFTVPAFQDCIARRHFIRKRVNLLIDVDFVILTLGLIEAWFDCESGLYLNTPPSPDLAAQFPSRFRFRILSEADVVQSVTRIFELLFGKNPGMRIVLTVSPVPLGATFAGDDISVANANSKATLLCAANRLLREFPNVFYFPSYEIVTLSNRAVVWEPDGRHVRPMFAERVMDFFCREMLGMSLADSQRPHNTVA